MTRSSSTVHNHSVELNRSCSLCLTAVNCHAVSALPLHCIITYNVDLDLHILKHLINIILCINTIFICILILTMSVTCDSFRFTAHLSSLCYTRLIQQQGDSYTVRAHTSDSDYKRRYMIQAGRGHTSNNNKLVHYVIATNV